MALMGFGLVALAGNPPAALADTGCTSVGTMSVTVTCAVGTSDTWTVPTRVAQATFDVQGGAGGAGIQTPDQNSASGGNGGHVTATLSVTPGTTYTIAVGSQGGTGEAFSNAPGGVPGGGPGADNATRCCPEHDGGGGGGGASIVATGPITADTTNWLLAAGGGGGGGQTDLGGQGGDGGGLSGGDGQGYYNSIGHGGNQTGSKGSGNHLNADNFGGGGGGYWGGGGAGFAAQGFAGGGGGSGFAGTSGVFQSATETGNGTVVITYRTADRVITGTNPGGVVVAPGTSVLIEGATVGGTVVADGSSSVVICGSTIKGSVTVSHATGFVLIGDAGDDKCPVNNIGGSLTMKHNTHGLEAINNKVAGAVITSGNSGTGPFKEDKAPEVSGNGP
jgi:hypothetical protein